MKSLAFILALTLCFCSYAAAQEQKLRRAVTVNVVSGEPIKGEFVRADENGVIIKNGVAETSIKLADIVSMVFGESTPTPTPEVSAGNIRSKEAAQKAIAALRKLHSATVVGVNFVEYGRILIDATATVDGEMAAIEEGELKTEIRSALIEYAYAAQVWNYYVRNPRAGVPSKSDLGRQLVSGYGVPVKISVFTSVPRELALSAIWGKAGRHFQRAVELSFQ